MAHRLYYALIMALTTALAGLDYGPYYDPYYGLYYSPDYGLYHGPHYGPYHGIYYGAYRNP